MIVISHEMGFARSVAHRVLSWTTTDREENTPTSSFPIRGNDRTRLFLSQILH